MKIKTIELYEYDELPDDIKAKVLENERDINVDYDWHKWTLEDWEGKLEAMGFEDANISFSGFWSQGDGASFTSKRVNIEDFLASQKCKTRFKALLKALKKDEIESNFDVSRISHHYSHEYTVTVDSEILYNRDYKPEKYVLIEGQEGELRKLMLETVRELSRKIYRELQQDYEYLTSDAAVIDTIKANEYTFTASGKMEN